MALDLNSSSNFFEHLVKGEVQFVKAFLAKHPGFDTNQVDNFELPKTPLVWCITKVEHENDNYAKIMQLVLEHPKTDVNTKFGQYHRTAMHVAAGSGVGGDKANVVEPGCSILSSVGAKLLLNSRHNVNINLSDSNGRTPLKFAMVNVESESDMYADILRVLLENKNCTADANIRIVG